MTCFFEFFIIFIALEKHGALYKTTDFSDTVIVPLRVMGARGSGSGEFILISENVFDRVCYFQNT